MRLLAYWRGPAAVALNADWSAEHAPPEQVGQSGTFNKSEACNGAARRWLAWDGAGVAARRTASTA
jgi:hypothetical protein